MNTDTIDALTQSLAGSFAFSGIAVAQGDSRHFAIRCAPGIVADKDAMFRVASVSKLVVGQAVAAFVKTKATGWGTDIADILGWSLRHPFYRDVPVTLGMIASHSAGLSDTAGYIMPSDVSLADWCTGRRVFDTCPGTAFSYANLGYLVLAEALENLSGLPFPEAVAPYMPEPGGFNWVGVSSVNRLPTYRFDGCRFLSQIDAETAPVMPSRNPGAWCPQGGLRTSLTGMLQLAERLGEADIAPLWTQQMGGGEYLDGGFESSGAGVQIFDQPVFYPRPLVGHFGNAYGFNGGVWYDRAADISFAYALNGLPLGDTSDAFSPVERHIFKMIAGLYTP